MTEEDTFIKLKRRPLQEIYETWPDDVNLRDYLKEQGYTVNEYLDYWGLRQNVGAKTLNHWREFYAKPI